MKKQNIIFIIALLIFSIYNLNSQICQWAESIGGTINDYSSDYCKSSSLDNMNNLYVSGTFSSNTITFNNEISLIKGNTGNNGYIAKYNSIGICQWAKKIDGNINYINIVADAESSIYVAGSFYLGTLVFNNDIQLTSTGNNDGFIAKYNSDGVCQWAEKIAGTENDIVNGIDVDNVGNIAVTGRYSSLLLNFNNGIELNNSNIGYKNIYVAKYNSEGLCQWAEKITANFDCNAIGIYFDSIGNIVFGGDFWSENLLFNNGISLQRYGGLFGASNVFFAKYNSEGICQWAKRVAGTGNASFLESMYLDTQNNIYLSGRSNCATLEFNNGISLSLTGGSYDSFFSKFNDNGICQFANGIAGVSGVEGYFPISSDSEGNIYIAKDFTKDSIIFNVENILFKEGTRNVFFAKYNSSGILEWVERITGNNCWATSISIDNIDEVYLTGYFNSPNLTFNNNISLTNIFSGIDGYFAKFDKNKVLSIELNSGWNLISSNVIPENTNIIDIFSEVNNLKLVKNSAGNIYDPAFGINTIGNWNINHGYWVYMTAPSILQIEGIEVNPLETPINLNQGWNLVSYLRNSEMLAPDALQGISGSMLFAKDRMGNLYHPLYGINTIGNMQVGQGYWIYMNAPAILTYPGN